MPDPTAAKRPRVGLYLGLRSAFPYPVTLKPLGTGLDLLSHMFFFGVPIAFAVRKAPDGQVTSAASAAKGSPMVR